MHEVEQQTAMALPMSSRSGLDPDIVLDAAPREAAGMEEEVFDLEATGIQHPYQSSGEMTAMDEVAVAVREEIERVCERKTEASELSIDEKVKGPETTVNEPEPAVHEPKASVLGVPQLTSPQAATSAAETLQALAEVGDQLRRSEDEDGAAQSDTVIKVKEDEDLPIEDEDLPKASRRNTMSQTELESMRNFIRRSHLDEAISPQALHLSRLRSIKMRCSRCRHVNILSGRASRPLAIFVLVATYTFLVGSVVYAFSLTDRMGRCMVKDYFKEKGLHTSLTPEQQADHYLSHSAALGLVLPVLGHVAAWLLQKAPTDHLRRVAYYAFTVWLGQFISAIIIVMQCHDVGTFKVLFYLNRIILVVVIIWSILLVNGRIKVLEEAYLESLGLKTMQRLMLMGATLGPSWTVPGKVLAPVRWLTLVVWFTWMIMVFCAFRRIRQTIDHAKDISSGHLAEESSQVDRVLRSQLYGIASCQLSSQISTTLQALTNGQLWPLVIDTNSVVVFFLLQTLPFLFDSIANAFFAAVLSGARKGAWSAIKKDQELDAIRHDRWKHEALKYTPDTTTQWQEKIEELAGRGFTLESLLKFYRGLGTEHMLHYDPSHHTTADVVRRSIIPLSKPGRSSYATVMMNGEYCRPDKMITHNWGNLFRDLVAAILADALDEDEYSMISSVLQKDQHVVEKWVKKKGVQKRKYWVCAFSVNQHTGICGGNPNKDKDPVLGEEHPTCDCGLPKAWNTTAPLHPDGRGINCEMNKFHLMMCFLSATDPFFMQIVAIDEFFVLFSRAWCVSEIAAANEGGLRQCLKIHSRTSLAANEEKLKKLKVMNMEATREEDKKEILAGIPDKDAFDATVQRLLLQELIPCWEHFDDKEQLSRAGRLARLVDTGEKLAIDKDMLRASRIATGGINIASAGEGEEVSFHTLHSAQGGQDSAPAFTSKANEDKNTPACKSDKDKD